MVMDVMRIPMRGNSHLKVVKFVLYLTRWGRQKVAGNVAPDRLGNVTLHFEDDERSPSVNAQREGSFDVNRTLCFCCALSPAFIARSTTG